AHVKVLAANKAGVKDLQQVRQNLHDRFPVRQRLVAEMIDMAALRVGRDDGVGYLRKRFFQTNVGGHGQFPQSAETTLLALSGSGARAQRFSPVFKNVWIKKQAIAARGRGLPVSLPGDRRSTAAADEETG